MSGTYYGYSSGIKSLLFSASLTAMGQEWQADFSLEKGELGSRVPREDSRGL